jgi:ankyrin repeat protein
MEGEVQDRFQAEQILKKHGIQVAGKPAGELFMQSARLNLINIFNYFKKSVPLDYSNKFNDSVLHYAAKGGNVEMVQFLISSVKQTPNLFGELPVHYAIEEGHKQVFEILAENVPVDVRDKFGDTLLHLAAREGHDEICRILLRKRRELVNAVNETGQTPLAYAMEAGALSAGEVIQKAGGRLEKS